MARDLKTKKRLSKGEATEFNKKAKKKLPKAAATTDPDLQVKKRPSKADLKLVIERLKKDSGLKKEAGLLVLKYIPFYLKSEGLTKKLLKEIIRLWAEGSERIRVVCLLCLIRIYTKLNDEERKQLIIKNLYNSFLEKCRITKHETMSMIGFMRHSLIELYKLDPKIAFKQAQTSCQQLTATLKNALTHKNEETYKTVLNWQFANCLILLSGLITSQPDDSPVKALTHQIIQLNLGAMNFLSSPRYYPFYCHLIENLIRLSISTNLFIPVLPQIMGILEKVQIPKLSTKKDKKKKDTEEDGDKDCENNDVEDEKEVKEYNMDLLNHVSLDEAHSLEYNVAVINRIHDLILEYLSSQCHRISFPELVLLPCVQLKKWLKKNPGQESQKLKNLYEKIKADSQKIEEDRRTVDFSFTNYPAVDAWEKRMKDAAKMSLPKLVEK